VVDDDAVSDRCGQVGASVKLIESNKSKHEYARRSALLRLGAGTVVRGEMDAFTDPDFSPSMLKQSSKLKYASEQHWDSSAA
jgi:hypothetical protein